MDKTFAETQQIEPFDWNRFLSNPPNKGTAEYREATKLSGSWVSCACGNQCAIIPRDSVAEEFPGTPKDGQLKHLGYRFSNQIEQAEWPEARATLAAIEARSAVLIREELAKRNASP